MLTHLHVKNLAVVENIEIDFGDGFIVLTGETGVGKSIIIGAVNIALGSKVSADVIRAGAEYALVEIEFLLAASEEELLRTFDIFPEDGRIIISRKIMNGRSVSKVNGETVSLTELRRVSSVLIDMHGQHEHQSLLSIDNHLAITDTYNKAVIDELKSNVAALYKEYVELNREMESFNSSEEERMREISFLQFEKDEIENAHLAEDEEEELAAQYKKLSNAEKLIGAAGEAYGYTSSGNINAADLISSALSSLNTYAEYDEAVASFVGTLADVENILSDVNHELSAYLEDFTFDSEQFEEIENRLDYIRKLYSKYDGSYETTVEYLDKISEKLEILEDFEQNKKKVADKLEDVRGKLDVYCDKLTEARKVSADELKVLINESLSDLNFTNAVFDIDMQKLEGYSAKGRDRVEFIISTNPGEPPKPLAKVASGGELSRIMLAIKSVLAKKDSIHTLIFDEIDTGISGRTAQKVSEKLAALSKDHQIICITHLAQIAAMADTHYVIRKEQDDGRVHTTLELLDDAGREGELARIIGGAQITEAVIASAREMKVLAENLKKGF